MKIVGVKIYKYDELNDKSKEMANLENSMLYGGNHFDNIKEKLAFLRGDDNWFTNDGRGFNFPKDEVSITQELLEALEKALNRIEYVEKTAKFVDEWFEGKKLIRGVIKKATA